MNLAERVTGLFRGRVAVVGVGNPFRGDDAAGSLVARSLAGSELPYVVDAGEVPESYAGSIAAWRPDAVLVVDAVDLGAAPGSMALLGRSDMAGCAVDTHRVPLRIVMHYLESVTGAATWLLAIQPENIGFDAP